MDEGMSRATRPVEKKKGKSKIVIIILLVLLVIACGIVGFFLWKNSQKPKTDFLIDKMAQDGFLEGKSDEEINRLLNQVVEEGMFNISINSNPVFEDGASEGNLRIENVPGNQYYMKVKITLDDTGEVIYQSDGIKQGQYIEKAPLSVDLDAGTYNATATFTAIDPKSLTEQGQTAAQIQIEVLH